MIISKLQGGLANQLFQWAYGRYLSEKYNTPLYLDVSFYQNQFGVTKREFSLNKFPNLKYQILPNDRNISNWSFESKNKITNLSDNFIYSELNYDEDSHYYLNGYWQSEKYFNEIEDLIREELKPSDEIIKKLESVPLINTNNISLHIRRTDYLTSNGFHTVQSIEYYKKSLDIIGEYEYLFIFSDDINWCKDNLNFRNMIFIEGFDDVEDIWLMSMCNHNIIANSSFSWWGAWLNSNPNKKIITPSNWFGSQVNLNTDDIVPKNWIII